MKPIYSGFFDVPSAHSHTAFLPSSSTLRHKNSDETDRHNNAFPFPNNSLVIKQISPPSERTNSQSLPSPTFLYLCACFVGRHRLLCYRVFCPPPPPIVFLLHARLVNAKKIIANGSFFPFFSAEPYVAPVRADTIIAIYLPSPPNWTTTPFFPLLRPRGNISSSFLFFFHSCSTARFHEEFDSFLYKKSTSLAHQKTFRNRQHSFSSFFARIKTNPAAISQARHSVTRVGDGFFSCFSLFLSCIYAKCHDAVGGVRWTTTGGGRR